MATITLDITKEQAEAMLASSRETETRLRSELDTILLNIDRLARFVGEPRYGGPYKTHVKSFTMPGRYYAVERDGAGKWSCSCDAFKFHPDIPCKHLRKVM